MTRIAIRFRQLGRRTAARSHQLGLLSNVERRTSNVERRTSNVERKNCRRLAEHAGHTRPEPMQRLLRLARRDAGAVRDRTLARRTQHAAGPTYIRVVDEAEASGQVWRDEVRMRPTAEQDRDALARLVEEDSDPFEVELYEQAADPQVLSIDRAQRSYTGQ